MIDNEKMKENIKTTMAIEGYYMKDKDFEIIDKYLSHEISLQEGINKIKSEFSDLS